MFLVVSRVTADRMHEDVALRSILRFAYPDSRLGRVGAAPLHFSHGARVFCVFSWFHVVVVPFLYQQVARDGRGAYKHVFEGQLVFLLGTFSRRSPAPIATESENRHNSTGLWGAQLLLAVTAALELGLRLYACGPSYCSDWWV